MGNHDPLQGFCMLRANLLSIMSNGSLWPLMRLLWLRSEPLSTIYKQPLTQLQFTFLLHLMLELGELRELWGLLDFPFLGVQMELVTWPLQNCKDPFCSRWKNEHIDPSRVSGVFGKKLKSGPTVGPSTKNILLSPSKGESKKTNRLRKYFGKTPTREGWRRGGELEAKKLPMGTEGWMKPKRSLSVFKVSSQKESYSLWILIATPTENLRWRKEVEVNGEEEENERSIFLNVLIS